MPEGGSGRALRSITTMVPLVRVCVALAVALLAGSLAAGALASSSRSVFDSSVVVRKHVSRPGDYAITVVVRSSAAKVNRVELHIGSLEREAILDRHHRRARISLRLHIDGGSLAIMAVGHRARPRLTVALRRLGSTSKDSKPSKPSSPAPATAQTTATAQNTTTTSTTATPTTPPPPAPTGPPGPGPYQSLAWSDDFITDWSNEGGSGAATEQIPSTWAYDDYGGCGSGESSYPASPGSAYLSSQGLVIPVNETGPNQYTTAQLDTRTIPGESWQYGTIEASIELPSGQGLCPAFWMYSDSGSAEIDILEAPSFVSGNYGPFAPYSVFTLHADQTQQWEVAATPSNWNPAGANVYGVIWTPTSITWTVNYVPYAEATASSLSDPSLWSAFTSGNLHLILDEAVGGWPGDPPSGTAYTGQPMTVQWVKVYQ